MSAPPDKKQHPGATLQPMENVDRNIFWYLLRDFVAKKVEMENLMVGDESCIKFGDVIFKTSAPVTLYQPAGGEKEYNVDAILFYTYYIHSPVYLTYSNRAITAKKIGLRRGDVLGLKPFLLGETNVLPRVIDPTKSESPMPYKLVENKPEMVMKIDCSSGEKYYTLTDNIGSGTSKSLSGSMYSRPYYRSFLRIWAEKFKVQHCKRFTLFPLTDDVREELNVPWDTDDIFHAYITVTGLPVTEFYGCGFGPTKTKATWAAAREVVKRMYFAGLITPKLYRYAGINIGCAKDKKIRKLWDREMASATVNTKKLQKALKKGEVPERLLKSESELEIAEPLLNKTKKIIQKTQRMLLAVEKGHNAVLRRKRKAIDEKEAKLAVKKRNCYVTVVSAADWGVGEPGVRDKSQADFNGDLDPSIPILNLFGSADDDSTGATKAGLDPRSSAKNDEDVQIINLFDGDDQKSHDDDVIVVPAERPRTPLSAPRTPTSVRTETTDSGVSVDDEDCQIVSVVTKRDKIALVTLDESDNEEESCNDKPGCSSAKPHKRICSPERLPNRIFAVEGDKVIKEEVSERNKDKKKIRASDETVIVLGNDDDMNEKDMAGNVDELEAEYKAVHDKLGVMYMPSSSNVAALIASRKERYAKAFVKFDQEVWQHFKLNSQDDRTFSWKMQIRDKLQDIVREVYPDSRLVVFGSTVNGCGAYNSDMDLCLCVKDRNFTFNSRRIFSSDTLMELFRQLMSRFRGFVDKCDYINARVPILKVVLKEPYQELEIDINCNNTSGIYSSHLLHYYSRIDDRYPALCLVVKHWAIKKGINDAFSGTLSSYTLELLVLHFLQCGTYPPILPNLQMLYPGMFTRQHGFDSLQLFSDFPSPLPKREINQTTIGELLISFFDYYARFDYMNHAISISRGTVFNRSELSPTTQYFKIFVEDPYEGRNTAQAVIRMDNFKKIQTAFTTGRNAFVGFCAGAPCLANINVQ